MKTKKEVVAKLRELNEMLKEFYQKLEDFTGNLIEKENLSEKKIREIRDDDYKFTDAIIGEFKPNIAAIAYINIKNVKSYVAYSLAIIQAMIESFEENKDIYECLKKRGFKIS